ncbi:MAG: hypothetical protein KF878_30010 [Planctomycetes bacterium]|nr:hypothetical protein [Planctomycetota bacterium]
MVEGDTHEKSASRLRCAYCHDAAVGGSETCAGCGTILHRECMALAGVCPTLGCGTVVRPAEKARHGGRRRLRRVWVGIALAVLAGLWLVVPRLPTMLTMATGWPFESAPARWHYSNALVSECRRLMDDAGTHGGYVRAGRLAEATKTYGYFKRVRTDNPRVIDSLPSILQEVEPIEVSVSRDAVSLSWHAAGYGYGYSLIVLRDAESEEARNLRLRDRSFNRSIELAPGVWSNYPYH